MFFFKDILQYHQKFVLILVTVIVMVNIFSVISCDWCHFKVIFFVIPSNNKRKLHTNGPNLERITLRLSQIYIYALSNSFRLCLFQLHYSLYIYFLFIIYIYIYIYIYIIKKQHFKTIQTELCSRPSFHLYLCQI